MRDHVSKSVVVKELEVSKVNWSRGTEKPKLWFAETITLAQQFRLWRRVGRRERERERRKEGRVKRKTGWSWLVNVLVTTFAGWSQLAFPGTKEARPGSFKIVDSWERRVARQLNYHEHAIKISRRRYTRGFASENARGALHRPWRDCPES